jgi:hypothetical protein
LLRFRHSKARKQERDISGTCPSRAAGDWYDSCISNMGRERCAFVCSPQRDRFFFTLEGGRICSGLHLVIRICVSGLKSRCISPRGDDRCSPLRGGSLLLLSAERHFWFFVFFGFFAVPQFFRWHPRFHAGLLVLPLCGAAPTFLCSGVQTGDMVDTCTETSLTHDGQGFTVFRSSFATR